MHFIPRTTRLLVTYSDLACRPLGREELLFQQEYGLYDLTVLTAVRVSEKEPGLVIGDTHFETFILCKLPLPAVHTQHCLLGSLRTRNYDPAESLRDFSSHGHTWINEPCEGSAKVSAMTPAINVLEQLHPLLKRP